jgi:hypothetical protein
MSKKIYATKMFGAELETTLPSGRSIVFRTVSGLGVGYMAVTDRSMQEEIESLPIFTDEKPEKINPIGPTKIFLFSEEQTPAEKKPSTTSPKAGAAELTGIPSEQSPAEEAGKSVAPIKIESVKNIQQAKEVLRGEPYNVAFQRLNTPDNIMKVARELGVEFPNLQLVVVNPA